MNRVQVDVTSFESLYQEYKQTKEELETEKEEILAELRGSTGYFASARADRNRADIETFYETGTGKAALSQTEGMIKATKKATEYNGSVVKTKNQSFYNELICMFRRRRNPLRNTLLVMQLP